MFLVHAKKVKESLSGTFGINLPEWTKTLIWLIGLVVLLGLTLKDFSPLLDDYYENNKATQIDIIVITNSSFQQPQLSLHLPHYKNDMRQEEALMTITNHLLNGTEADCMECQALTNVSWDVWKKMNFTRGDNTSLDNLYNALTIAFVRKLLNKSDSLENVLSEKYSAWNEPLVTAGINFLIWRAHLDHWFKTPDELGGSLLDEAQENLDRLFDSVMKAICRELEFTMKDSKSQYNSSKVDTNKTSFDFLLNSTTPVILDSKGLWFALPQSDSIRHNFLFWTLNADRQRDMWNPHRMPKERKMPLLLYGDTAVQYRSAVEPDKVELFKISNDSYFHQNYVVVKYKTSMTTKEDRSGIKDSCYKETNPDLCLAKCTKKWTIDNCRCIPFTYRTGLDLNPKDRELPYCTESMYNDCDPLSTREQQREQCLKTTCQNACSYTTYGWQITHTFDPYLVLDGFALEMQILPQLEPYVEFTLTDKSTREQFLSAVGGLLNFYLGLSGLSLFVFIIGCMDFFKKYYRSRNSDNINPKTVSLWQDSLYAINSWRFVSQTPVQLKKDDVKSQQSTPSIPKCTTDKASENEIKKRQGAFKAEIEAAVKEQLRAAIADLKEQLTMHRNQQFITNFDIDE